MKKIIIFSALFFALHSLIGMKDDPYATLPSPDIIYSISKKDVVSFLAVLEDIKRDLKTTCASNNEKKVFDVCFVEIKDKISKTKNFNSLRPLLKLGRDDFVEKAFKFSTKNHYQDPYVIVNALKETGSGTFANLIKQDLLRKLDMHFHY